MTTEAEIQAFLARGGKITTCKASAKTSYKDQIKGWTIATLVKELENLEEKISIFSQDENSETKFFNSLCKKHEAISAVLDSKGWTAPKPVKASDSSGQAWFVSDVDGDGYRD